jgi:hypothetical protein
MGSFSSPPVFMATTTTTTATTPIVKKTQKLKAKKNLSLSTLSDRE